MLNPGPQPEFGVASRGVDARAAGRVAPAARLPVHSVEASATDRDALAAAAALLPPGTLVYLPKLPKRSHADVNDKIRIVRELGLTPVPHVAARSLGSWQELEEFVAGAVRVGGTDRLLVIGGDERSPAGPFADSAAVIASGVLEASGIRRVDVAGYPDGHPSIDAQVLEADLRRKVELARKRGLQPTVVTQFSFQPQRIADYCLQLAQIVPDVPVHAGVVGPTSARRLLQFARICGVGTSLRAVEKLGLDSLRLVTQADPGSQSRALSTRATAGTAGNLDGMHLFTFGNLVETAAWASEHARADAI